MAERSVAPMQRTMEAFAGVPAGEPNAEPDPEAEAEAGGEAGDDGAADGGTADVGTVMDRLDRMQAQLDALSGRDRKGGQGG